MKKTQLFFGILAGVGLTSCLLPSSLLAQSVLSQPGEVKPTDTFQEQNLDPFSGARDGGSSGLMDILHRVQLGNIRSLNEYSAEQSQNMDKAAEQFRCLQLARLQNQDQQAAALSCGSPSANPTIRIPSQN